MRATRFDSIRFDGALEKARHTRPLVLVLGKKRATR
jgi:hypothetical protein